MNEKVTVQTVARWEGHEHVIPHGSILKFLNLREGVIGRVMGPTHTPYWLLADGSISRGAILPQVKK